MKPINKPELNPDGISVKGCTIIYAPAGQAGEYSALAANPYRGCGHKCAYCLSEDTRVQMADGITKAISDVQLGDEIIGVRDTGNDLWPWKYTVATVTATIKSVKMAYRVETESGKQITCSGDHRWLTAERGWKYTMPAKSGQRPYLTTNNAIRSLGPAVSPYDETEDYRRGYLSGIIKGDGHLSRYDYSGKYQRANRKIPQTTDVQHHFRLAMDDLDPVLRTHGFLSRFGIETSFFDFKDTEGSSMHAIRVDSRATFEAISGIIQPFDSREWLRGFVAGIFDAEGGSSAACRIHNTDEDILQTVERAHSQFGFTTNRDKPNEVGCATVRILGGLSEATRFFQIFNPTLKRKWDIIDRSVCDSDKVVSIEKLSSMMMYDISTTSENFIANGLVSHNCYVPNVLRMDRKEFDEGATPRANFLHLLRNDAVKYRRLGITEQVMLSFTTDPYFPGDNTLTREVLETLQEYGMGVCTLTKGGHRALRDIGIFRPGRDAFASTLTSLNDDFSHKWERGATLPQDRIDTLRTFHDNGIYTWVSLEPVLDTEATIEIIRRTHSFVDLYKIGRVNYVGLTKTTDWKKFTADVLNVVSEVGAAHYIKRDLQPFLPEGYQNPMRVKQFKPEPQHPFPIIGQAT